MNRDCICEEINAEYRRIVEGNLPKVTANAADEAHAEPNFGTTMPSVLISTPVSSGTCLCRPDLGPTEPSVARLYW
jgi:hypothetical protein